MVLNIPGYSASPNLLNGSPHHQAVANGNSSIEAAAQRNAAGGNKKRKSKKSRKSIKYKYLGGAAGYAETQKLDDPTSSYPTLYSPADTQHKLLSAVVTNKVNSIGDSGLSKGGKKRRTKRRKYKLRR